MILVSRLVVKIELICLLLSQANLTRRPSSFVQFHRKCPFPIPISDMDVQRTCFQETLSYAEAGLDRCLEIEVVKEEDQSEKSCNFNFDQTKMSHPIRKYLPADIDLEDTMWSCTLSDSSKLCDGFSECLTDECGCHDSQIDVFYCADGSGCIAWSGLCDDVQDCMDGSDECLCSGHVIVPAPEIGGQVCLSEKSLCSIVTKQSLSPGSRASKAIAARCESGVTRLPTVEQSPVEICLTEEQAYEVLFSNSMPEASRIQDYCKKNCSQVKGFNKNWHGFCDKIHPGNMVDYIFICDMKNYGENYHITILCDEKTDCKNHADEIGCPGSNRFYCNPNSGTDWVSTDKVCDNTKDCANGADECGTCKFEALSSSEFLIQSRVVLVVTVIMGILIITLNVWEGYKCWSMKCSRKSRAIDKILLLQIFGYDILMGVYLISIVVAALVLKFKGDYCQLEQIWRASSFCPTLGVIFSFSSHGSLLAIAFISITRFLTCHSFVVDIKVRAVVVSCVVVTMINFVHSVLPLIPISAVKDVFRTGLYLTNLTENPFFSLNPINLSRLGELHEGMLHREKGDTYSMINDLRNVTSRSEIFDVLEISYYGNTGLCIHNIFKDREQEMFKSYKMVYCTVLTLLLCLVTSAYLKILSVQRKSMMAVNPNTANSTAQDSSSTTLTVKVALMIGSQLMCWIPFIITVMYFQFFTGKPASPMVFETFALVVIPVNSFLNPLFYSELYKKIKNWAYGKWRQLVEYMSPMDVPSPDTDYDEVQVSHP